MLHVLARYSSASERYYGHWKGSITVWYTDNICYWIKLRGCASAPAIYLFQPLTSRVSSWFSPLPYPKQEVFLPSELVVYYAFWSSFLFCTLKSECSLILHRIAHFAAEQKFKPAVECIWNSASYMGNNWQRNSALVRTCAAFGRMYAPWLKGSWFFQGDPVYFWGGIGTFVCSLQQSEGCCRFQEGMNVVFGTLRWLPRIAPLVVWFGFQASSILLKR